MCIRDRPYDLIATAESASATVSCDPAIYRGNKLGLRLGIDFGRTNDPTVCWTLERVGDVLVTREVLVLRNMSVPDQMEVCLLYTSDVYKRQLLP